MPFTVQDFEDLLRLLELHPEWRSQLRRVLLTEELLAVPERMAHVEQLLAELAQRDERQNALLEELVAAVRDNSRQITDLRETVQEHSRQISELRQTVQEHSRQISELRQTVQEHSRQIAELREMVQEHSRQISELRQTVQEHSRQIAELREIVQEHTRQIAELRETVQAHTRQLIELRETVQEHSRQIVELREIVREHTRQIVELRETVQFLAQRLDKVSDRVDMLVGAELELRVQRRLSSWLGRLIRGLRVRAPGDWSLELRPKLRHEAFERLLDADLLARGRFNGGEESAVWLVVEVSHVIDERDVNRAIEWAWLMRRDGLVALPVVVGSRLTPGAREFAEQEGVLIIEADFASVRTEGWERTRQRWVA